MKKSLLGFFALVLCIGLFPASTFAQEAPGTSGGDIGIDGGFTIDGGSTYILQSPPPSVKSVKRNNGNGTTPTGYAEARLQVTNTNSCAGMILTAITSLDLTTTYDHSWICGNTEKGYISYALQSNKIPAKKLMFHFWSSSTGSFCIPETN